MFFNRIVISLFFVSQLVCGGKNRFSFGDHIRKELTNKRNIPLVIALLGVYYFYRERNRVNCENLLRVKQLDEDMKSILLERQTTVADLETVVDDQKKSLADLLAFIESLKDVVKNQHAIFFERDCCTDEQLQGFLSFCKSCREIISIVLKSKNLSKGELREMLKDAKTSLQSIFKLFIDSMDINKNSKTIGELQKKVKSLEENIDIKDQEIDNLRKRNDEEVDALKKKQSGQLKQISDELDKIVKKGDQEKQVSEKTIMKTIESLKLLLQKYEIISVEMSKMRDETDNLQKKNYDLQKRCEDKDNDRGFKDELTHTIACITIERDSILHAKNEQLKMFKSIIDRFNCEVKTMQKRYQDSLERLQENAARAILQKEHEFSERVSELERCKNELSTKFEQSESELRTDYQKKANELSRQYDNAIEEVKSSWQMQPVLVFHDATLKKQIMHNPYIGLF